MATTSHTIGDTTYYVRGTVPKLLLLSGTHGDESEVNDCLAQYIEAHQDILPDYVYIPHLSPSAVALGTRRNKYGNDLNREFKKTTTDKEALAAMQIFRKFTYTLAIAFHEDPDRTTSFYLYDSEQMNDDKLLTYQNCITETGAKLFTGIDDPADPHLSSHIEKGYIAEPVESTDNDHGFSMQWLVTQGIAKRIFNPEIPGRGDIKLKLKLVEAIFHFSLPFV